MAELSYKGGQISYTAKGKGNAIVFLHGFLESKDIWTDYANKLSRRHRVICIDLPGHGHTTCWGYSHSMEFMAQCVLAVLKSQNVRKFHLIGHSMGGYVSMAIGEQKPDHVKGIVLFHSSVSDDPEQKKKERDKLIRLVQRNKELFIREAVPNLFNLKHKPYKRAIARISKQALSTSIQGIIAALEGMKIRENREMILKFAPYPVLYLIGRHDNVLPWQKLENEVNTSENASSLMLEKTGHMGFIEEPDACLKGIRAFVNS